MRVLADCFPRILFTSLLVIWKRPYKLRLLEILVECEDTGDLFDGSRLQTGLYLQIKILPERDQIYYFNRQIVLIFCTLRVQEKFGAVL